MKRAVSISIGSSKRDKAVEVDLLGEKVRIERIGTDGDMEKAAQLFKELDGKVDAFGLGIPIALHSTQALKRLAPIAVPIAGRLPFTWVYPTGEKQEMRVPKWQKYYEWATVISGDMHYVRRHVPDRLPGKVIVTNTTTATDIALLKQIGIKYLITTTPVLEGRSFGTNMMEAALIAASGKGRVLTHAELTELIDQLNLQPQIQELN